MVIDASVVVDWVAPRTDVAAPAQRLLQTIRATGEDVLAPRLVLEEVGNALLTGIRRGRWSGAEADTAVELLRQAPLRLVDRREDLDRAWELARRFDEHPLYDMVYVATAERIGHRLVTADAALLRRVRGLPFVELLA